MHRTFKWSYTSWILVGTIAFMIFFAMAVVYIYELTLNDAKQSHQLQQTEMAKSAATGLEFYLGHLIEDMQLLGIYSGKIDLHDTELQSEINQVYHHYQKRIVSSIFLTGEDTDIIYHYGDTLPAWLATLLREQKVWARTPEKRYDYWYSKVLPVHSADPHSGLFFVILKPILQKRSADSDGIFAGFIGYVISFNLLVEQFIRPLKLGEADFAWIMDGRGRLVFHPAHTDMLLRSINNPAPECRSCHVSFDVQKKMLISQASTGEYKIGEEPAKIMAYHPVNLRNEKWVVVISTLLPKVTASLRHKFQLFFILGFVILGVITFFGLSLYYVNAKRIRAEEAGRQFEQMQQLQQQLNHASKLASIGELVDTVAHEINTPTGIIAAQADAMLWQKDSKKLYSEEIRMIKEQTKRMSKYTKSLLNYSKRVYFNPEPNEINRLIDECIYLLGHRFRSQNVAVLKNYDQNLPQVLLDRGQMEQVIINLLNNACDAINGNGKVEISTHTIYKATTIKGERKIDGVEIKITDNGKGIKSSDIDQIFNPFFSTKLPSEGTGLGLYISKSIMNRHQGKITVTSALQHGTTFKIFLPLNFKTYDDA